VRNNYKCNICGKTYIIDTSKEINQCPYCGVIASVHQVEKKVAEKETILDEKWLYFRYEIDLVKPENQTEEEFLVYCNFELMPKILNVTSLQMLGADTQEVKEGWFKKSYVFKGSLNKSITLRRNVYNDNNYSIVISFNEMTKEVNYKTNAMFMTFDEDSNTFIEDYSPGAPRLKDENEPREYNFSPIQFIKGLRIFHSIEFGLITRFGDSRLDIFKKEERMLINLHYNENNIPIITETDGLGYFTYPFEKRVKLYLEQTKVEEELFNSWKFKDFVEWILTKKNVDEYSGNFCLKIEKILNKYNLG